jgi:tetratricopeptide (TPR) repeat protein
VHKGQKRTEKAIEMYKKAIEVNPQYSYAYNNLGNIYKNSGEYEEAIKCYENAVEHRSNYTLCFANLGVCLLKF